MVSVPFNDIRMTSFRPAYVSGGYTQFLAGFLGCGGCALFTLTGANPIEIYEFCAEREGGKLDTGVGASTMLAFLESKGYTYFRVDHEDICNRRGQMSTNLKADHLLLSARHVAKDETSWFVNWSNLEFHCLTDYAATVTGMMNRPLTQKSGMYILYNPGHAIDVKGIQDYQDRKLFGVLVSDKTKEMLKGLSEVRRLVLRARELQQKAIGELTEEELNFLGGSLEKIAEALPTPVKILES